MRKTLGIHRNKYEILQTCKINFEHKKNIFKYVGKDYDLPQNQNQQNSNLCISTSTKGSNRSIENIDNERSYEIYDEAKGYLEQVNENRKKMTAEIKLRMAAFKQSDIKIYDENISKYSTKSVENLVKSERLLTNIKHLKGDSAVSENFYRNMEKSLAMEIRQVSKSLRAQEKEYFDRLKMYEAGTVNMAIKLRQQDIEKMKDQFDLQVYQTETSEQTQRTKQIAELVKSISQLSNIYKELNDLVIQQGSLLDRIDFNIQEAFTHTQKGVVHLSSANEKAFSPCAQKCIFILIALIVTMAIVIGFKVSK